MRRWLLLAAAVVTEVSGSLALDAAVEEPWWYVVVVLGYLLAFTALALVLRAGMPLGVAYGVWGASGVALTAVLGALVLGEPLTALTSAGIALVVAGVLLVELGSHPARRSVRRRHGQGPA